MPVADDELDGVTVIDGVSGDVMLPLGVKLEEPLGVWVLEADELGVGLLVPVPLEDGVFEADAGRHGREIPGTIWPPQLNPCPKHTAPPEAISAHEW